MSEQELILRKVFKQRFANAKAKIDMIYKAAGGEFIFEAGSSTFRAEPEGESFNFFLILRCIDCNKLLIDRRISGINTLGLFIKKCYDAVRTGELSSFDRCSECSKQETQSDRLKALQRRLNNLECEMKEQQKKYFTKINKLQKQLHEKNCKIKSPGV